MGRFCNFLQKYFNFKTISIKIMLLKRGIEISIDSGPAPRGAFRGRAPQITACAPPNKNCTLPSENCVQKKVTGSVPLECSLRPETPKTLVITSEFVSKNCFFAHFAIKTLFVFVSFPHVSGKFAHISRWRPLFFGPLSQIRGNKVFVPSKKIVYAPQSRYSSAKSALTAITWLNCERKYRLCGPG